MIRGISQNAFRDRYVFFRADRLSVATGSLSQVSQDDAPGTCIIYSYNIFPFYFPDSPPLSELPSAP